MLWILGVTTFLIAFYYYLIKPFEYWPKQGVKQGTRLQLFRDNWGWFFKRKPITEAVCYIYNQFPNSRFSGFYQFALPTLCLKDPELIKQITVKDFDNFLDHKNFLPDDFDTLWSNNLFILRGQRWREMRATLSPSFTSSKMKSMFNLMLECTETFVKHFLEKKEQVVTVEMKNIFSRFANDVIATTAFGLKVNSIEDRENEFYLMGKEATSFTVGDVWMVLRFLLLMVWPKLFKMLKLKVFSLKVSQFFYKLVGDTINYREKSNIVRNDMIQLLMEARKGNQKVEETDKIYENNFAAVNEDAKLKIAPLKRDITDEDIVAQAMIFFFAGFESVSGLMCFISYELAVNPDIQERLREEIDTVRLNEGTLTYEALVKMNYMDMVVSESLRKWPNTPFVDRVCTKPYTIESTQPGEPTVRLEEGANVWLPIFALHRDPKYFPDPEKFDPERFNSENKSKIVPYSYIPFGAGPRNCIGSRFALLETKSIIFHILTHFEIVPIKKTVIPLKLSVKHFSLHSENGFWLGLKRRTKTVQ